MPAYPSTEAATSFEHLLRELLEATRRDEDVEVTRASASGWLVDEDDLLVMDDATGHQWVVTVRGIE